jgi:hypothetical protein
MTDSIDDIIFPLALPTAFILPDQTLKVNKEPDFIPLAAYKPGSKAAAAKEKKGRKATCTMLISVFVFSS